MFILSGKPHFGIQNLIKKTGKSWFLIQKLLFKSKEKQSKHLKILDSVTKPIALYAIEAWGDSLKKDFFQNDIEKFHLSLCKPILGVQKLC